MKRKYGFLLSLILLLMVPTTGYAQLWTGIVDPSRAIDWSKAGIPGGIPNRTTICATLNPGATATQISSAIASCPSGQVVFLSAGTYILSSGIDFAGKSNVTLRGAGANQTFLIFTGYTSCYGLGGAICLASSDNTYANGPPANIVNWTAGYAKGSTQVTLSSAAGITPNVTILDLDQCDDGFTGASCSGSPSDPGTIFVCETLNTCSGEIGSNNYRPHRSQGQLVMATAVNGSNVTISSPIYMPNFRSGQSPQAWTYTPLLNSGIENLSVDGTSSGGASNIILFNTWQCWIKGVRSINPLHYHATLFEAAHSVVRDSYFFLTQGAATESYGIQLQVDADTLIENNIFQQITAPVTVNGSSHGAVASYNFSINDFFNTQNFMMFAQWLHSAGIGMLLFEGNQGAGFAGDDIHGTHHFVTLFRNYYNGWETGKTTQTNSVYLAAYSRYFNLIGNVLGKSGYHNQYQSIAPNSTNQDTSIYEIGYGNGSPNDSLVNSTVMRWGNYDTVNGSVRFVNTEVPSGLSLYSNAVPASQALPASFYLSARPSWWSSLTWPAVGPDVTGGNIANVGGHVYAIPAQLCYTNSMAGPADGTGSVLSYNASTCYGSSSAPAAPTNLSVVVN